MFLPETNILKFLLLFNSAGNYKDLSISRKSHTKFFVNHLLRGETNSLLIMQ